MLDQNQAAIILELVSRSIAFDEHDNIVCVPTGFDLSAVADAVADLEAEVSGDGGRAFVIEFLARLCPDLAAHAGADIGRPAQLSLEQHQLAAASLLQEFGGAAELPPGWMVRRRGVMLDLSGWVPLDVLDALARIAVAVEVVLFGCARSQVNVTSGVKPEVWTAPTLASTVERLLAAGRNASEIVESTRRLLAALDPEFDGAVTPTVVELAVERVSASIAHRLRYVGHVSPEDVDRAVQSARLIIVPDSERESPSFATLMHEQGGLGAREAETEAYEKMDEEMRTRQPTSAGRRVCTVYSIVDASTVFASVTGVTISTDMLNSMGDSVRLASGHTIARAGDAWELWSRWS